ncbi:MAG TPA: lipopolysaccharide transport periplasmic protein LptA [Cellvibrionaceae bacterium]
MSPSNYRPIYISISSLVVLLLSASALALPEDRQAKIELSSSQYVFDQRNGLIIYSGDAELKQGSLQINADKIVVHYQGDNTVEKIEATGSPARLQQQPSAEQDVITANAEQIIYNRLNNTVDMVSGVRLEQNGAIVQGHRIHLDLTQELVQADSDEEGQERIYMTIPPGNLPD